MNIAQTDSSDLNGPVLEFRDVSFKWPAGKGLTGVSFTVSLGRFVLISGPSGSGKSTLLRLAVRLEEAQMGGILLQGKPLDSYYPPELRTRIGFVQQTPVMLPGTVRDNLLLPFSMHIRKGCSVPSDEVLEEWMDRLALDGVSLEAEAVDLSVGQRQRLSLIRAALPHPGVLCLDEPTSALDRESRERVEMAAEQLASEGIAVLMVSHTEYRPKCSCIHLSVADGRVEVSA